MHPTALQGLPQVRFSPAGSISPSGLLFSRTGMIRNGFISPTRMAWFAFTMPPAISRLRQAEVVAGLPSGGSHSTRNFVFTPDDRRMLVSVGSRSNAAEGLGTLIGALQSWSGKYPLGASLGTQTDRGRCWCSIRTEIVLERSPRAFAIAWVLRCILRAGTCIVRKRARWTGRRSGA